MHLWLPALLQKFCAALLCAGEREATSTSSTQEPAATGETAAGSGGKVSHTSCSSTAYMCRRLCRCWPCKVRQLDHSLSAWPAAAVAADSSALAVQAFGPGSFTSVLWWLLSGDTCPLPRPPILTVLSCTMFVAAPCLQLPCEGAGSCFSDQQAAAGGPAAAHAAGAADVGTAARD